MSRRRSQQEPKPQRERALRAFGLYRRGWTYAVIGKRLGPVSAARARLLVWHGYHIVWRRCPTIFPPEKRISSRQIHTLKERGRTQIDERVMDQIAREIETGIDEPRIAGWPSWLPHPARPHYDAR